MPLIYNSGTNEHEAKLIVIEAFSLEFNPIMDKLNEVLSKYNLDKEVISLGWIDGKIQTIINYTSFPCSSTTAGQLT